MKTKWDISALAVLGAVIGEFVGPLTLLQSSETNGYLVLGQIIGASIGYAVLFAAIFAAITGARNRLID
jgi:hypothetical protein